MEYLLSRDVAADGLEVAGLVVQLLGRMAELLEAVEAGLVTQAEALAVMDAEQPTVAAEVILPCWTKGQGKFHQLVG